MLVSIPFSIEISTIINFLFGMLTGIVLFLAFLTYYFFRGSRVNLEKIKRSENDLSEEDLTRLIKNRQALLKRNIRLSEETAVRLTTQMSYELVEEISRYFFPKSKYPMLELSIHELLDLSHYITNRIDELLDNRVLRSMKNVRVVQIVKMYERQRVVTESGIYKAVRKYKLGRVVKYGGMVLNAVNPLYWFRKLVINTSLDAITRQVCSGIIGIVGEETAKVYSKKLFDKDVELSVVDEAIEELMEQAENEGELDEAN